MLLMIGKIKMLKDWFNKIYKNVQKSDNEPLIDTIKELKTNNKEKDVFINNLWTNIDELKEEITALKVINELLTTPFIPYKNVLDYKRKYELAHEAKPFKYPFRGDGNSIDIKRALYLSQEDEQSFKQECIEYFFEKYKPKNELDVVEMVQKHFRYKKNFTYKTEQIDVWENALVGWRSLVGDCDLLAILMYNIIYYSLQKLSLDNHIWRLELMISTLLGEGGHALNKWLHTDGEWYSIESTYDLKGNYSRNWLRTPIRYNNLYSKFRGFATKNKSWKGSLSSLKNVMIE